MRSSWFRQLGFGASPRGLEVWANGYETSGAAWRACVRGDWLLWLIATAKRPPPHPRPRGRRLRGARPAQGPLGGAAAC